MSAYAISITLKAGYADSVERTRAALAEQGFGVLTEIDVSATMKAKLDADVAPYVILGACNPRLAHQALTVDPSIGLLLPCNVVVRAVDHKHTLVEAMNPDVVVNATENPALSRLAEQARTKLRAALSTLAGDPQLVSP